jgi:Raf kinase inhibitor-like YbhB/YbcL family protein
MTLALRSSFEQGDRIPERHSRAGGNVSPPLSWSGLPQGTRQLALILDDPDAPGPFPFVHWVIYGLPAEAPSLPEGAAGESSPGFLQGINSTRGQGYFGPSPPPGPAHRYMFHLYALDHTLALKPGLDKRALLIAMEGHVLEEAVLVGTYGESEAFTTA